jgi:two-component system sensor histidine kinase CpxA
MRLPLYARILLFFLLNVAVIGVALGLVMRAQLRGGLDSFMGSLVSARLQAAGERMYNRLSSLPEAEWHSAVSEVESTYGVRAALMRSPVSPLAGSQLVLPEALKKELIEHQERRRRPEGGRPPQIPPPRERRDNFFEGPDDGFPPPPRDRRDDGPDDLRQPPDRFREGPDNPPRGPRRPERGGSPSLPSQYGKVFLRAGNPEEYWAVIMLPPPPAYFSRPPEPLLFVINTPSIFTGGLLFDLRPWLVGIGAALGVSALLWLPLVRGITGKVKETMHATEQMALGKFDVRVKENRSDELGRLAHAVNSMAQQLDGYVSGQRRFTGDIAHELCSPISRMQAALGILEVRATGEKERQYIETLNEELQHMSHLVQELLQFSKASLHRELTLQEVPLATLTAGVIARESSGHPDDAVRAEIDESLTVSAEPELLARALSNVIRNALRYAGDDGPVTLAAVRRGDGVLITISDQGPGVPPEALPKLFDAFYRPDTARSREQGGAGLGLAIVKSCIEACRGRVTASNIQPRGLRVEITLPTAPSSDKHDRV